MSSLASVTETIAIDGRFRGPPRSGNGGYACGLIARHLRGDVCVRLAAPPPLDVALRLESTPDETRLYHDGTLIGTGVRSLLELTAPPAPSFAEAEVASRSYLGFVRHDFPECFVCGPNRSAADGLRIFPGAVAGRDLVAAPWIPSRSLAGRSDTIDPVFIWAALDCPGAFAALPLPEGKTIVLGELCARIASEVRPESRYIAVGWPLHIGGRKHIVGTAIFAEHGELVALARATWIEVPVSDFVF
jgi:hypothetical protein